MHSLTCPRLVTLAAQVKLRLLMCAMVKGSHPTRRAMVEDEMVMSPAALASRFDKVEKTQPRLMSASWGHPGAKCWSCLGLRVSVCTLDSSVSTRNERRGHDCHRVEIHRCCVCWSRQVSLEGQVD